MVDRQQGPLHFGAERAENAEARVRRLVQPALDRPRCAEETLLQRPKGDLAKVRLPQRLRAESLATVV